MTIELDSVAANAPETRGGNGEDGALRNQRRTRLW